MARLDRYNYNVEVHLIKTEGCDVSGPTGRRGQQVGCWGNAQVLIHPPPPHDDDDDDDDDDGDDVWRHWWSADYDVNRQVAWRHHRISQFDRYFLQNSM